MKPPALPFEKALSQKERTLSPPLPNPARPRFITAASLFDGHDAAINVMRRILQSSGAEVIHLGHNRSVQDIVSAAIQEDAHAIAISSYQGGHVEFFKYTIDLLRQNGVAHIHLYGGGGGTITPQEIQELEAYGVSKIFSPEDGRRLGLQGMIDFMLTQSTQKPLGHIDWASLNYFGSMPKALGQALTCLEVDQECQAELESSHQTALEDLEKSLKRQNPNSFVVGITGTGGAGKSSFTDELLWRLLEKDPKTRAAVLAIDPTRRKTGGALLGDRLRMNSLSNERCFMRSLATRDANASLSQATERCVSVLKAAGFDWIFVETGGIGQADTSIVGIADVNIYVMTGEYGAPTQLEKINMLDYADLVIVNKVDKAGSLDALIEVRKQFRRNHLVFERLSPDLYPIFPTISSRFNDPGVTAAFEQLILLKETPGEKRRALSKPIKFSETSIEAIVPKERASYLSEIRGEILNYRRRVEESCEEIASLEALERVLLAGPSDNARKELETSLKSAREKLDPEAVERLKEWTELAKQYSGDEFSYQVRKKTVSVPLFNESLSHQRIRKIALPKFKSQVDLLRFLSLENLPGYFPYTAGVFPFKRTEEDPKRQFAGEGTPERTNRRFHLLCAQEKAKRLSTAFDSVTLYGHDPDKRPDIYGKIGESGVSVCTLEDAKKLYEGFDLCHPNTSVSMTINGPAPMLLAFFFNAAIDQKVDLFQKENGRLPNADERKKIQAETLSTVRGTVQADILKEDQAQNTCIFSTEFALRMMGDIQKYFIDLEIKNYYSVSISGYHIAEAGANPITQLAFTLANGFTYLEYYRARGMKIDDFAPNFSFFFSNSLDPEYTVIGRVARRIWAIALKYRYQANDRSQKLKYHIQTSGRSLHAQEISFNDIRTTLQALLAYFDHCNSLHTNAYDEAVTTPTEESVRRAMAIQLILSREFGWAKNENPMQGSFFIEELTDLVEEAVLNEFERLSARGGVLGAMEAHYQRSKIQEESLHYEKLKHSGELPIIGVNTFLNPHPESVAPHLSPTQLTRATYEEKDQQITNLRAFQHRNADQAKVALGRLKNAARQRKNLFEELMDAARFCSLGQMTQALKEVGGEYRRVI